MVSVDVSLAGKNIIIIYYIHYLTLTRLKLKPKSRIKKFHNSHSFLIITKTNFQPSNHYFNCHSQRNKYNLFVAFINNITFYHSRFSKCFYSTVLLSLSVQFSCSVMSDSATPWTAACQTCLSMTNFQSLLKSRPSRQWCHPTISSSVTPFSSCLQSFPASGSFPMSQFLASGGASASASVLPMNIQDWFPLGWTGWISLQSKGLSRVFSNTTVQKHGTQLSL